MLYIVWLKIYKYKYIYISDVKISALTQAINFFSLTLNAINAGAEPRVATPLITAVSVDK